MAPPRGALESQTEAANSTPEHCQLPATPTPFTLSSDDDPRQALSLSEPIFRDGFDDPATCFDYATIGRSSYQFVDGQLLGTDYEPKDLYTWWTYVERQSGNTYVEVSATNGDCIAKDAVGLVIRVDPETAAGGYGVEVSCDGSWRFLRHRQGQVAEVLQGWTESEAINPGPQATNRIGLWGYANEFFVLQNGQQLGRVVDRNLLHSFDIFALYVRAHQTFDLMATFDDFFFWHIPFLPE